MNIWQAARQLRSLISAETWTNGTRVFADDSVVVTTVDKAGKALDDRLIEPIVLVCVADGASDPQHAGQQPDLIVRTLSLVVIQRNENLKLGEGAIIGANRVGVNDSRGRGVLELGPRIYNAGKRLTEENGVVIQLRLLSEPAVRLDVEDDAYAVEEYSAEVVCAADAYYPPCRRLTAQPRTGEVTLTWKLPASRYDRNRTRLLRKSGTSAPTSITDGTVLAAGETDESFVDTPSSGTYSYALFMTYDDFDVASKTDLQVSASATKTSVVVP